MSRPPGQCSYLGVSVSVKQMISHVSAEIGQLFPVDLTLHGNIVWAAPPPTNIKEIESDRSDSTRSISWCLFCKWIREIFTTYRR